MNVVHLDLVVRLIFQYLGGEAREWFKILPNTSINKWEEMENYFMQKSREKVDDGYILTKFNARKKKCNEDVSEFIKRFNKYIITFLLKLDLHGLLPKWFLLELS